LTPNSRSYLNHFLQPDTLIPDPSNPQAWNRYSYVYNSPIKYSDPTGHSVACDPYEGDCGQDDELISEDNGNNDDADNDNGPTQPENDIVGGSQPQYSPASDEGGCQFPLEYLCQLPEDVQTQIIRGDYSSFEIASVSKLDEKIFDSEFALLKYMILYEITPLGVASVLGVKSFAGTARIIGVGEAAVTPHIPYKFERLPGTAEGDIVVRIGANAPAVRGMRQYTEHVFRNDVLIATYSGVDYGQ
jgi:hypothetical protein